MGRDIRRRNGSKASPHCDTPQAIQRHLRAWIGLKEVLNLACGPSGLDSPKGRARGNRVVGAPATNMMPPIIPHYLAGVCEPPNLPALSRYPTMLVGPPFSFFCAPFLVLGRWLLRLNPVQRDGHPQRHGQVPGWALGKIRTYVDSILCMHHCFPRISKAYNDM